FVALVLAWYHGERGAQRVSSTELVILALLLAIGGGLLWRFAPQSVPASAPTQAANPMTSPGAPISAKSIAVLPFENLSHDQDNEYFAAGMQDLILTKLADIGDLKVVSRTSTAKYASHPEDLKTIARQLGVATILEGSVQKAGNDVLINVQLIDAKTDNHVWAQSYTRTLDNIFGVEGEVAQKVADALKAKLTPAESAAVARVGTRNTAALEAYLKGLYYLDDSNRTGDRTELERSIPLFKQAIDADPDYADAWAYLALAYQKLGGHEAHAETAARRALALDPDNAHAHTMYAFALVDKGEFDAALAEAGKAVVLPSHTASDLAGMGFTLLFAGKIDQATQAFRRATEADPHMDYAQEWAAISQAMLRNYPVAREGLRQVVASDPGNANAVAELGKIERIGFGDLAAARKTLQSAAVPPASSATLSDAWYELDYAERDYPAALAVLDAVPVSSFDDKPRALYAARIHRAQGDAAKAQSAFALAREQVEAKLKAAPDNPDLLAALAQCLAGTGQDADAIAAAKRAVELQPIGRRTYTLPPALVNLARVQARAGDAAGAIATLGKLLSMSAGFDMSVNELRISPDWDPIRNDMRFKALLEKYATGG
ncbi:MAG: tetratricopeptide repeat protein, partial [Proteobacteria bacterium]|nr:tetratricopeptide repeat protein [Pseudomonadota bacterium]